MRENDYISIPEFAKMLGLSRIAVYKKVRAGRIKARKVGRMFLIPLSCAQDILGRNLGENAKRTIERAVKKTVAEYGEALRMLGNE